MNQTSCCSESRLHSHDLKGTLMDNSGEVDSSMSKEELIQALGVVKMNQDEIAEIAQKSSADAMTVNMQVYHQPYGQDPQEFPIVYSKPLKTSSAEPVRRRMKITSTVVDVDPGWSKPEDLGYIMIRHLIPKFAMNVTEEQRKQVEESMIAVFFKGELLSELHPSDFLFIPVKDVTQFKIKVMKGVPFTPPLVEYVLLPK